MQFPYFSSFRLPQNQIKTLTKNIQTYISFYIIQTSLYNIMKNKQSTSPHRFFTKVQKFPIALHISASTLQNSDNKTTLNTNDQKSEPQFPPLNPRSDSRTITDLRQELKNIKSEVTKLIEEGFVKSTIPSDWLQSSANFSTGSKTSNTISVQTEQLQELEQENKRKELQMLEKQIEVNYYKGQWQKLRVVVKQKQTKQAQWKKKQKHLQKQIKSLQKCKDELLRCSEVLQKSLKQLKQQVQEKDELNKEYLMIILKKQEGQAEMKQYFAGLKQQLRSLEQQLAHRKAENNELIRIIEFKQNEVEILNERIQSQAKELQFQIERSKMKKSLALSRQENKSNEQRRTISIFDLEEYSHQDQINKLSQQMHFLKLQLKNKQKLVFMMLNDMKNMEKELKVADQEHQQLQTSNKMIEELNLLLIRAEAKRLNAKFKYL